MRYRDFPNGPSIDIYTKVVLFRIVLSTKNFHIFNYGLAKKRFHNT